MIETSSEINLNQMILVQHRFKLWKKFLPVSCYLTFLLKGAIKSSALLKSSILLKKSFCPKIYIWNMLKLYSINLKISLRVHKRPSKHPWNLLERPLKLPGITLDHPWNTLETALEHFVTSLTWTVKTEAIWHCLFQMP